MLGEYMNLIVTLGVFIILLILLVIVPILWVINRKLNRNVKCLEIAIEALEKFDKSITDNDSLLTKNFQEIVTKAASVIDSKQVSIKDAVDTVIKGLEIYGSNTVRVIDELKQGIKPFKTIADNMTSNKKPRGTRRQYRSKTPPTNNSGV